MEKRKSFPLRIDPRLYGVLEKWAADELRSVNAQIELLLRESAKRAGRWHPAMSDPAREGEREPDDSQP